MICKQCDETYFAFFHDCKLNVSSAQCLGHMSAVQLENHYRDSLPLTLVDKELLREMGINPDE